MTCLENNVERWKYRVCSFYILNRRYGFVMVMYDTTFSNRDTLIYKHYNRMTLFQKLTVFIIINVSNSILFIFLIFSWYTSLFTIKILTNSLYLKVPLIIQFINLATTKNIMQMHVQVHRQTTWLKKQRKKSLKIANPFLENKYNILKNIWKSDEKVNQH
jgi:hypothetical protein